MGLERIGALLSTIAIWGLWIVASLSVPWEAHGLYGLLFIVFSWYGALRATVVMNKMIGITDG